jgi:hypothetical protein
LKWLVWGYIIVFWWMLNRLWNVDRVVDEIGCWWTLNQLWNVDRVVDEIGLLTNVKPTMKCWLSCWWMLNQLWNVDWVVDEC